jgi:hypothetical protein
MAAAPVSRAVNGYRKRCPFVTFGPPDGLAAKRGRKQEKRVSTKLLPVSVFVKRKIH